MRAACVELTNLFGLGDERHLRPLASDDGPVLWPVDRADDGARVGRARLPRARRVPRLPRATRPTATACGATTAAAYDRDAARAQAGAEHAREFVAHVSRRVRSVASACSRSTPSCSVTGGTKASWWLEAVLDEATRQGLKLTTLDDALERHEPSAPSPVLPVGSWGEGGDLRTWSGPRGRRARLGGADGRAALLARRSHPPASGACASCWRCNRATGRFSSRARPPATTRSSAPAGTSLPSIVRWPRATTALEPALRGLAPDLG